MSDDTVQPRLGEDHPGPPPMLPDEGGTYQFVAAKGRAKAQLKKVKDSARMPNPAPDTAPGAGTLNEESDDEQSDLDQPGSDASSNLDAEA